MAGLPTEEALAHLGLAYSAAELGDQRTARKHLRQFHATRRRVPSRYLTLLGAFCEAHLALVGNQRAAALRQLHRALALGRGLGMFGLHWWLPVNMGRLCAEALAAAVEVDYVRSLIRRNRLPLSAAALALETWPWPIKIRVMGAFELVLDDRPVDATGKAPHRCLMFLRALAALDGHNVHQDTLTDSVWPDTDGDAGRRSFDTTLHRLRNLLGHHDAITLHNGLLSLNRTYCWLDACALEALCGQFSRALAAGTAIDYGSVERLLALYRGRLLELEPDQGWLVIRRQRLSQRFVRTITALGRHYEEHGAWNNAIACYRESLAGETSNEILYQRLMHLYIRHGRYAEAVGIYRQCRTVLATLHLIPSVETERILVGIPP